MASEGSTNRVRLKDDRFAAQRLALPPLPEQRRITAKLDAVAERVESSRRRLEQVTAESLLACRDLIHAAVERGGAQMRVGDVMRRRSLDVTVEPEQTYDFAGVYSFGRGVFRGGRKPGSNFAYTQLTRLRAGDFTYPKLMAWEGALGVVPQDCDGLVVSPEFPVFQIDADTLRPEIADVYFRDPRVWPTLSAGSTGTNMRRRRLNPSDFLKMIMPIPSRSDQERLARMIRIQRRVAEANTRSISDLETLLPDLLAEAFGEASPSTTLAR